MAKQQQVRVPDIGDFHDVPVIEVLVAPGATVQAEDPLVTLESDKATMDVPAPSAGTVVEVLVKVGDTVSEETPIMIIESADPVSEVATDTAPEAVAPATTAPEAGQAATNAVPLEVVVPDIGDFTGVPVIEVLVAPGDVIAAEDPLITLESDKATMDVPAPQAGTVQALHVSVGDSVSEGSPVLTLIADAAASASPPSPAPAPEPNPPATPMPVAQPLAPPCSPGGRGAPTAALNCAPAQRSRVAHATPAVRRFARELGVNLVGVTGTGRKGRILKEDVKTFIKRALTQPLAAAPVGAVSGMGIPPIPAVDFAKFGEIEVHPLSRIKKISGPHLHRAWLNVPHVTHHDEADITELEAFRKSLKEEGAKRGVRITSLAFITKAVAATLQAFPSFNCALSADGESLVTKKYVHVGIAVDTPNGLVVPVLRDVDRKGIIEIAAEMGEISARARDGKLKPTEMQGGCISISSLGGIGGTAFTPIVNAPEVAILGVTRARMQPIWDGQNFVPRLMLPLDASYDHRVIDGAEAARFMAHLCRVLGDVRRLLL